MKTCALATIPGDGIGKEVIPAGRQVLQVLAESGGAFRFAFEDFGWGGDWLAAAKGRLAPGSRVDQLRPGRDDRPTTTR